MIYKHPFPWHVLPGDSALQSGRFFERYFSHRRAAVAYQRRVKTAFPEEPCALTRLRVWEACGRLFATKAEAQRADDLRKQRLAQLHGHECPA